MPSRSLSDCKQELAQKFVLGRQRYMEENPGKELIVTCTYRSPEEQFALFQIGRQLQVDTWVLDDDPRTRIVTQLDGKTKKSKHNSSPSEALDFAVLVGGKITWREAEYVIVGRIMEMFDLRWGGDWDGNPITKHTFYDYPHLELKG